MNKPNNTKYELQDERLREKSHGSFLHLRDYGNFSSLLTLFENAFFSR